MRGQHQGRGRRGHHAQRVRRLHIRSGLQGPLDRGLQVRLERVEVTLRVGFTGTIRPVTLKVIWCMLAACVRFPHPGVLVAKVGYFGVKSAKVYRVQMGTKPAKVGRLGPRCAKVRRGLHPAPTGASAKRSSIHAASKVATLKSVPRADQSC